MAQYIVKFTDYQDKDSIKSKIESCGATYITSLLKGKFDLIEADDEAIAEVKALDGIESVEADGTATPCAQVIDYSINVTKVKRNAYNRGYKGDGIVVAVIDSGINYNHEDLPEVYKGCYITGGAASSVDVPEDYYDTVGHGTAVAATIVMQNNSKGYLGVAPNVKLMVVKAATDNGDGSATMTYTNMAASIEWAVDNGADVINISYSQTSTSSVVQAACEYAYHNNVSVVCSAGNRGDDDESEFPDGDLTATERVNMWKNYLGVVVVAALIEDSSATYVVTSADYSSFGSGLDFSAPSNVYLPAADTTNEYKLWKGTSFSAPFIAGMIALIRQRFSGISADDIYRFLQDNCVTIGDGDTDYYGNGMPVMPNLALSYPTYDIDYQFFTDFSEYTTGEQPSDWTERWVTDDSIWTVNELSGAAGNKVLTHYTTANGRTLLSWNDLDGKVDVELVTRFKTSERSTVASSAPAWLRTRCSGASSAETAYNLRLYYDSGSSYYNLHIGKYVAGTFTSLIYIHSALLADTWYFMRFRVKGTALMAKIWADGEDEPTEWMLETTDSDITAGGWSGLGRVSYSADTIYDVFGVGINGTKAPKSEDEIISYPKPTIANNSSNLKLGMAIGL